MRGRADGEVGGWRGGVDVDVVETGVYVFSCYGGGERVEGC